MESYDRSCIYDASFPLNKNKIAGPFTMEVLRAYSCTGGFPGSRPLQGDCFMSNFGLMGGSRAELCLLGRKSK